MLKNLRIGARLFIVLAVMVILVGGVMALGHYGMASINARLKTVYEDRTVCLVQLSTIEHDLFEVRVRLRALSENEGGNMRATLLAETKTFDRDLDETWRAYLATYLDPDEKVLAAAFAAQLAVYRTVEEKVVALSSSDGLAAAHALSSGEADQAFRKLIAVLREDVMLQGRVAKQEYENGRRVYEHVVLLNRIATLAGIALALVLSVLIVREITGSIAGMVAAMRRLAWGDTAIDVPGRDRHDEIGDMSKAVAIFKTNAIERQRLEAVEKAALRAKSIFLANMSHELRTPLTSVIGFSQLMADDPTMNAGQRQKVEIINRSGNHLLALINNVLELSKIESGRMQLSELAVDLSDLIDTVVEMMRGQAERKGLILSARASGLPPGIVVDGPKLRQVLLNLLSNAVKFTEQGQVTLSVGAALIEADAVRLDFAVTDTGIGITAEDQQRVFESFVQATMPGTSSGTGLGLSISREYVQMMGGLLSLESTPGQGSTFCFSLRAALVDPPAVKSVLMGRVRGIEAQGERRRVVIAEDTPDIMLLVRSILDPLGFEIVEAKDGYEAVDAVAKLSPHLVIMDWRLPGMDGIEAIKRIRAMDRIVQPRIVVLTASAYEEHRVVAEQSGADDFLRKPFDQTEIVDLLERRLSVRIDREEFPAGGAARRSVIAEPSDSDLADLPERHRAMLAEAVSELNLAKISDVLDDIGTDYPKVAEGLVAMVGAAKFTELYERLRVHS